MYSRFFLLADSAHVDRSGKLHVQGIFENINSFTFPCIHQKMTIIAQLESSDKKTGPYTPTIQLKDNNGKIILQFSMPSFNFKNAPKKGTVVRHNLFIELENVQFHIPGLYTIILLIDNKFIDSTGFNVKQNKVISGGASA